MLSPEGPCCNNTGLVRPYQFPGIEVQVCLDKPANNENLGIEQLELYMK